MAYEFDDDDLSAAIEATEQEVFSDAAPDALTPEELEDNDSLLEQMSQMEDWNGSSVSDMRLAGEAAGNTPIGMTLAVDDDDLAAARQEGFEQGAQATYQQLAPHLPQPERPDMFANPEAWEANILAQARGEGIPPPNGYGASPYQKPDQFADPDGYERWLLAEARRQSGVNQFNEDRVNSSMAAAHREYGPAFEAAYRDITQGLDGRNPAHQAVVQNIINSPDPGRELMRTRELIETVNDSALRYAGGPHSPPPFAPGLIRRAAPLRNSMGEGPRSQDEALEQSIFNDATGLDEIWSQYR
jgi:hypothetical protein